MIKRNKITLKEIAEDHFNGESSNQNECSNNMINLVEKCVQDYIRGADLENSDLTKELILHNWLSVLDQYVFKSNPFALFQRESSQLGQEIRQRVGSVDRHDAAANLVGCRVEGHGELRSHGLSHERCNPRYDPRCREERPAH